MATTAKFKVSRITPYGWADNPAAGEVELTPDYASGRNAEWAQATPSGVIRMHISNPAAVREFTEGRAFTVLFTAEDE